MSRKNISLSDPIENRADDLIKLRGFSGLSDLIAALIREEHERHHRPALRENSPDYKPGTEPKPIIVIPSSSPKKEGKSAQTTNYAKGRRRGARKSDAMLKQVQEEEI